MPKKQLSIAKAVEQLLDSKPFIKDVFRINAVNYSGLARYLIPALQKKLERKRINLEAVIMGVKRYAERVKGKLVSDQVMQALAKCDLRLKSDIVDLTLKRTGPNYKLTLEAHEKINWAAGDIIHVYQSLSEIAILLDKKNAKLILDKISKADIINKEESLAMISLRTPPEILELPGFIYFILRLVAEEDISIIDVISTYSELVIVVKEEDGAKVYNIIFDTIKKARK